MKKSFLKNFHPLNIFHGYHYNGFWIAVVVGTIAAFVANFGLYKSVD